MSNELVIVTRNFDGRPVRQRRSDGYTHAREGDLGAAVARLQIPAAVGENPLANLSRADLEAALVAMAAVVRTLTGSGCTVVAPRVAPAMETAGDRRETA
jgi:hypothetical protein